MVPDQVTDFDDEDKAMDEWWTEDPSREEILCALWKGEESLYNFNVPGYRISGTKDVIIRKFATVLHVPRKYSIHIHSVKNIF